MIRSDRMTGRRRTRGGAILCSRLRALAALAFLGCLPALAACGREAPAKILLPAAAVRCWTCTREIRDLTFDGAETVWAATPGGLLRFDRVTGGWTVFTMADGLPSNQVLSVLDTSFGILWVGTDRGAARWDGHGFRRYGAPEGLPDDAVHVLAEGDDGTIYAGTGRGIARFRREAWEPMDDTHEFARRRVVGIAAVTDGSLWFAKENCLTHYLGGRRWKTYQRNVLNLQKKADLLSNSLLSITADREGTIWIGTKMGLSTFDGRSWGRRYFQERMATGDGLQDNWIQDVAMGPDGRVWVAHGESLDFDRSAGAARLGGSDRWTYLTSADGLPSDIVYKVKTGPDNLLWLGTARGLASYDGRQVTAHIPPVLLSGNKVIEILPRGDGVTVLTPLGSSEPGEESIRETPLPGGMKVACGTEVAGIIYAGGTKEGLFAFEEGRWRRDDFFSGRRISHLGGDGPDRVLATTADDVYLGRYGRWSPVSLGLPRDFLPLKAYRGPQGDLWLIGEQGRLNGADRMAIFACRGERCESVPVPAHALTHPASGAILFDREGRLHLFSPAGLYLQRDGWREVPLPLPRGSLSAARWDSRGRLWVSGRDGGLHVREGQAWREVLMLGLPAPAGITSLAWDGRERLWLGCAHQGLFRLDLGSAGSGGAGRPLDQPSGAAPGMSKM